MNTDFQITDELVNEFLSNSMGPLWEKVLAERWEQFKASKQPKREWEVLSYRYNPLNDLCDNIRMEYVTVDKTSKYWEDAQSGDSSYEIYSVMRLSDGNIWSINDKFIANAGCDLTIKSFEVEGHQMKVWSLEYGYWPLNSIRRPAIFTTEDGVDISIGDPYWYVTNDYKLYRGVCDSYTGGLVVAHRRVGDKYFSTKEKAEEYVFYKKELFSLDEIMDILRTMSDYAKGHDNKSYLRGKFFELSKDKLK